MILVNILGIYSFLKIEVEFWINDGWWLIQDMIYSKINRKAACFMMCHDLPDMKIDIDIDIKCTYQLHLGYMVIRNHWYDVKLAEILHVSF